MKLYGSLNNRFDENKMFCDKIEVGTGATIYSWSDTHAYEVTAVEDQKHVTIREYDHEAAGPCYSNQWTLVSNENNPEIKLEKRGNYWYKTYEHTLKMLEKRAKEDFEKDYFKTYEAALGYMKGMSGLTAKQLERLEAGKTIKTYKRINISFGVAQYYFDYEF